MEMQTEIRHCWGCSGWYPATTEYFHRNKAERSGLHSQCKICKNKANRIYAAKHRVPSTRINRRAANNQYIWSVKELGCCVCCGEQRPEVLMFHHREPKEKSFGLSDSRACEIEEIKVEINKCDLMCANCHLSLHYWDKHK